MRLLSCSLIVLATACAAPKEGDKMRDSTPSAAGDTAAGAGATRDTLRTPDDRARPETTSSARRDSAPSTPNAKASTPTAGKRPAPPTRVVPDPVILPRDSTRRP